MAQASSIEWTESTWNPVTGCTKISAGCTHCLDPSTLVLMSDWTTKQIKDVMPGDSVVAFNEGSEGVGLNKVYEKATVEKVWWTRKPAVRIRTDDGTVIMASTDHLFLKPPRGWFKAGNTRVLQTRMRRIAVAESIIGMSDLYCAGYIVGSTEGDGTMSEPLPGKEYREKQWYWRVAVIAKQSEFIERLVLSAARFGVTLVPKPFDSGTESKMIKVETRKRNNIVTLASLWDKSGRDFSRGYLAGIFDAEGSFGKSNGSRPTSLRIANTAPRILKEIVEHGKEAGFDFRIENFRGNHTKCARLYGALDGIGKFFGETRPALTYKKQGAFGCLIKGTKPTVLSVESVGEMDLIDIQTTKRTFVANGFLTHNCYAERMAKRLQAMGQKRYRNGFKVTLQPDVVDAPLHWKRPRMIFVNSMSDLFHKEVPTDYIKKCFSVMQQASQHTFQVLTKRPERVAKLASSLPWPGNVWMGATVENAEYVSRIRALVQVPAVVRFLSLEPLLGPIPRLPLKGIHWVIVGGESGPNARQMQADWVRQIRERCLMQRVPFFFKQWGGIQKNLAGRKLDGRYWDEMPVITGWIDETRHRRVA